MRTLSRGLVALVMMSSILLMPTAAGAADDAPKPEYLFVFDGRHGELTPISGAEGKFRFTMPLRRGDRLVTWFTDRPIRDAGHMTMKQFVDLWKPAPGDSFKADPPNVAISSGTKTVIATMTRTRLVPVEGGGQAIQSIMTVIPGDAAAALAQGDSHLSSHATRAGENAHEGVWRMRVVSVFVDITMTKSASQY